MFEMLLVMAVLAMLALGAAYVAAAIRMRDAQGRAGLVRFTIGGTLAAIALLALALSIRLGSLMLYIIPALVVFLGPVCALASALVEARARQAGAGARRALAVGAVLVFGGWGILMAGALVRVMSAMNPDGLRHSSLAAPAPPRMS